MLKPTCIRRFIHADSTPVLVRHSSPHSNQRSGKDGHQSKPNYNYKHIKVNAISDLFYSYILWHMKFNGEVLQRNIYASANAETAKRQDTRKC